MRGDCRGIQQRLPAYVEGETDERTGAVIATHLSACPACRREAEALEGAGRLLVSWQAPTVNPQLAVVFAERLAAQQAVSRRGAFRHRWAWATGLAALLMVGGFVLFQQGRLGIPEKSVVAMTPPEQRVTREHPVSLVYAPAARPAPTATAVAIAAAPAMRPRHIRHRTSRHPAASPAPPPAVEPIPDATILLMANLTETPPPAPASTANRAGAPIMAATPVAIKPADVLVADTLAGTE